MASLKHQVREIFDKVQHGIIISKMCDALLKIEKDADADLFWEVFVDHLTKSMTFYKMEASAEKIMKFVSMYATNPKREKPEANSSGFDDSMSEPMDPFLLKVFMFLVKYHNARDKAVRYRCCQLINKLLSQLGDEASIDETLSDHIYQCMMIRMRDKFPAIRIQAVMALIRLQDPTDEECPVIDAFLRSLETDINADVRKHIILNIALSRKTLPYVLGRIRDVKDVNRKTAYVILAEKVSVRALTIAQRIHVISVGLKDRSELVQQACGQLLRAWLRSYDNNVVKLLGALDTEGSVECSKMALEYLFKDAGITKMETHVKSLLELAKVPEEGGSVKMVAHDDLTPENVFYWYMMVKHLRTLGNEGEVLLQTLLPELTGFCAYIQRYAEKYFIDSAILTAFEGNEGSHEFVLEQLLNVAGLLDFSDEVGRKNLQTLIHNLLVCETVPLGLVKVLVARYGDVETNEDKFVQDLAEVIADVKQPMVRVISTAMKEKNRRNELQVARISVKINECKEDLEEAIAKQEYQQAALLKEHLSELHSEKDKLLMEMCSDVENNTEKRVERDDPETMLKSLTIASALLGLIKRKSLTPTLVTLRDELIFEGVKNEDPFIRKEAVMCLGLLSLLNKEFAMQHLILFLQVAQVDQELIQITAVKVIFDIFMMFGLQEFDVDTMNKEESSDKTQELDDMQEDEDGEKTIVSETPPTDNEEETNNKQGNAAEKVLEILLMFLESESPDLRTTIVEGMAKLLVIGRVLSAKILTKLILLWYNPITEDDVKLRHCLGVFLPVFAFESRSNQELLEEVFLPVVRTLLNAPTTSPLSQVNITNVIDLMIQLTDVRNLAQFQPRPNGSGNTTKPDFETHVHDSIAVKICNEIFTDTEDLEIVKIYLKTLTQLNISQRNITVVEDLKEMISKLIEIFKRSARVRKIAEKFLLQLENIANSKACSIASSQSSTQQSVTNTTNASSTVQENNVTDDNNKTLTNNPNLNEPDENEEAETTLTDIGAIALQKQMDDSISRDVKHKLSLSNDSIRSAKKPRLSNSVDFVVRPGEDDGIDIDSASD